MQETNIKEVLIPIAFLLDNPILPVLQCGKKLCLTVNYYGFKVVIFQLIPPYPISDIIKIINSFQSASCKLVYCYRFDSYILFSTYFNSFSTRLPQPLSGRYTLLSDYPWNTSATWQLHTVSAQELNYLYFYPGTQI